VSSKTKITKAPVMSTKVKNILEGMNFFLIHALENRKKYLFNVKSFTRNRLLTFNNLCVFLLSQSKRSLSIELNEYFGRLEQQACTKSAFSKARYRIKWSLFQDWNNYLVNMLYEKKNNAELLKWKGFFLKAIDGTSFYLFKDEDIEEEFGKHSNQYVSIPMARVGIEFDVLNGYCTRAQIQSCKESELSFAYKFLKDSSPSDIRIYDRFFACFELIYKHLHLRTHFVIRCSVNSNLVVSRFVASGKKQSVVVFPITRKAIASLQKQGYAVGASNFVKVRLIRVDIGTDEPEILITDLTDLKKYSRKDFGYLYGLRWGVETQIDQIKNKLQVEVFSGHKPEAIYQDFFAAIILSNLQQFICNESRSKLESINVGRKIKVNINQNVSIGLLRPRLVMLLSDKKEDIFEEIKSLFLNHLEPIRPGRTYQRNKSAKKLKGKYQTFKNYRRAS
jgi:hypothetical protein